MNKGSLVCEIEVSRLCGGRGKFASIRGLAKIETHCLLSILTMQAKALIQALAGEQLRLCLRKVG